MTFFERIFHSVLFEVGAVSLSTVAVLMIGSVNVGAAVGTGVIMAVIAMLWNFGFNYVFDKFFTGKREARRLSLRLFHTISFEAGLLLISVPLIAYMLNFTLWQAFWTDIGLTLLITLYALIFNWTYDLLRVRVRERFVRA